MASPLLFLLFCCFMGGIVVIRCSSTDKCHGTRYPNGSVEFRLSTQGNHCSWEWLHEDEVLAYDGIDSKDSRHQTVLDFTSDSLVLKLYLGNISYREDCLDSKRGVRIILCFCNVSSPDSLEDHRRHHYLVLIPALLFILFVSVLGAVLGLLCKKNPNLCSLMTTEAATSTQLAAGKENIV